MEPITRAPEAPDPQAQRSSKSYGTAVALSATLGFLGVQHFYLRRYGEGLLDLGLSFGCLVFFVMGEPLLALLFFLADAGHALTVTILLLTGNFRDGYGRIVAYPGQKLGPSHSNRTLRRTT